MYQNIRAEMARCGITQKQLADSVGVSHVTLCKWLNGKSAPTIENALSVAKVLGCDVAYLFARE